MRVFVFMHIPGSTFIFKCFGPGICPKVTFCWFERCRTRHPEREWKAFRLVMRAALRLRACPSCLNMHTLLAFVKEKANEAAIVTNGTLTRIILSVFEPRSESSAEPECHAAEVG